MIPKVFRCCHGWAALVCWLDHVLTCRWRWLCNIHDRAITTEPTRSQLRRFERAARRRYQRLIGARQPRAARAEQMRRLSEGAPVVRQAGRVDKPP